MSNDSNLVPFRALLYMGLFGFLSSLLLGVFGGASAVYYQYEMGIYFMILTPLLQGTFSGWVVRLASWKGRCRNRKVAMLIGGAMGAMSYGFFHIYEYLSEVYFSVFPMEGWKGVLDISSRYEVFRHFWAASASQGYLVGNNSLQDACFWTLLVAELVLAASLGAIIPGLGSWGKK